MATKQGVPGKSVQPLPYIDIQHDALSVLDDIEQGVVPREDIWISGYKIGSSSVHGKVRLEAREGGGVDMTPRDGVQVDRISRTQYTITIPNLDIRSTPIIFPRQVIHPPYARQKSTTPPLYISSLAYSQKRQRLAIAGPDGYLCVMASGLAGGANEAIMMKGHVGDVLDVKFFPSEEVVLSCSSDLSVRIWGLDGSNPRTLKGHTRAVTCTLIVGVGKEVLTGSRDGTVRLWNIGQGKEVRKWTMEKRGPVVALFQLEHGEENREGRKVMAILTDGRVEVLDLDNPEEIRKGVEGGDIGAAVVCAAWDGKGLLATGHTNGVIHIRHLDIDSTGSSAIRPSQEVTIRRNEASVYSLYWTPSGDLLLGTAAGLPCRLQITHGEEGMSVQVKEEYAGWEAVGIEAWAAASDGGVWCAGGEGGIRRY